MDGVAHVVGWVLAGALTVAGVICGLYWLYNVIVAPVFMVLAYLARCIVRLVRWVVRQVRRITPVPAPLN